MRLSLSVFAVAAVLAAPALAEESFPATLAGHAFLPALSLVEPPADAPFPAPITPPFSCEGRAFARRASPAWAGVRSNRNQAMFIGQTLRTSP